MLCKTAAKLFSGLAKFWFVQPHQFRDINNRQVSWYVAISSFSAYGFHFLILQRSLHLGHSQKDYIFAPMSAVSHDRTVPSNCKIQARYYTLQQSRFGATGILIPNAWTIMEISLCVFLSTSLNGYVVISSQDGR